jgi:hypothetical protein
VEIVTDITTRNLKRKDTSQNKKNIAKISTIHEFCNRKLNIKKWWLKTWHKPLKIFLYTGQKLTQIKYCKNA